MRESSCDRGFNILAMFQDIERVLIYRVDGTLRATKIGCPCDIKQNCYGKWQNKEIKSSYRLAGKNILHKMEDSQHDFVLWGGPQECPVYQSGKESTSELLRNLVDAVKDFVLLGYKTSKRMRGS